MTVSTAIAGRARFSINLRYAADRRSDPQALRRILVPVQSTGGVADVGGVNAGAGAGAPRRGMVTSAGAASRGGMGAMGGGSLPSAMPAAGAMFATPQLPMDGTQRTADLMEQWRQPGAAVPLDELAEIRVVT